MTSVTVTTDDMWRLKSKPLQSTVDEDTPVNFRPSDVSKETQSLKLGNACGFDGIPN
jgi:hypothetical protein